MAPRVETRSALPRRLALRLLKILLTSFLINPAVAAQEAPVPGPDGGGNPPQQVGYRGTGRPTEGVFVPRVDAPPLIEAFLDGRPELEVRQQFALVEGFVQRNPSDGEPATYLTSAYLGYDDDNLYVIFVARDPQPELVRARLSRREDIAADDQVSITIDTDQDQQRGYLFTVNPLGVQRDALWTEGQPADASFDTLWHSEGRRTEFGYVVSMSVPFKSLRFPRRDIQSWGIVLTRLVPRGAAEESTWPHVSSGLEGRLNQAGTITGLTQVSPGRNIRLIPYGTFRSFRALDGNTPVGPDFITDLADPNGGLDAKMVIKDAMVVDATFNPDFSQVESDQPQITANQRFEVFFPERRPFFLENANYFRTPFNLLFTRRIADPQVGLRTTGKVGGWALGGLVIDDRAPGRVVDSEDPLHGERARFGVVRVSRDLGAQSNIGGLFVDRSFAGGYNRVGALDTRVKLNANWVATAQLVASDTLRTDGTRLSGPAFQVGVDRTGRHLTYRLRYEDIHQDFRADAGFVPRVGVRRLMQMVRHRFRPEGDALISHGPGFWYEEFRDRAGERLDRSINPWYSFELAGRTNVGAFYWQQQVRLRPVDYAALETDRDYRVYQTGLWLNSEFLPALSVRVNANLGRRLNFVPVEGAAPEVGPGFGGDVELAWRPRTQLRLSARWLHETVNSPVDGERVMRNDIYRARLDYQFSRELSLRAIVQYDVLDANPLWTSLSSRRNLNADLLLTYLVNPWTSVYAGVNRNAQNLELINGGEANVLRRTHGPLLNDASQFFLKVSYLFSY